MISAAAGSILRREVVAAHLRGQHLLLPGHGEAGPTLEIYTYAETLTDRPRPVANRPGYGHLAFEVADVSAILDAVLSHGGQALGEVARTSVHGVGELEIVYVRDPEGNIIELQSWSSRQPTAPCVDRSPAHV